MQIVYLVVTTPDLGRVAVVNGADGWHLPRWDRQDRIPPANGAHMVLPLTAYVCPTDIVHWAPLWLPDAPGAVDRSYCVAVVDELAVPHSDDRDSEFVLVKRERLLSPDVLPAEEQLAVRTALGRIETPAVTFDSPDDVQSAIAWALRLIPETDAPVTSIARYRHGRRDLIVRFETSTGAVYLKAGNTRFADEAILTQHVQPLLPGRVPETLAVDPCEHRWLYRELPGVIMADAPLERHTIAAAVRALVSLQQASIGSDVIARHLASRRLTAVELFHAVDASIARAWRSLRPSDPLVSVVGPWNTLRDGMIRSCAAVDDLDIPSVLVLTDFWSQNILVMQNGIGFIDLGHSHWSHPTLPLWRFVRDIKRRCAPTARASVCQAIGTAFIDAWAPLAPPRVMARAIAQLWLIGRLFGIHIAAYDRDLYEQALGTELPPSDRATRLAPRVRDLLCVFAQQAVVPRPEELELAVALDL